MNCPTCDLPTWPYDDRTLTCKRGHHTPVAAQPADLPAAQPARSFMWVPGVIAGLLAGLLPHLL